MAEQLNDFDFLLQAANYCGGADAPHSEEARKAVDAYAKKLRIAAELAVEVVKIRAAKHTAMSLAEIADSRDEPL